MRIGIDVKTLSKRYTGIAIYVYEMIRYFNELDHDDEFFLYSNKDFSLDFDLGSNFHKIIYKAITGSLGIMFQLSKQLKKDKIDLFWGTEHCIVMGNHPFKQVVTIHDLAALHHPEVTTYYNGILQKFMAVPSCKRADMIIAISKSTAKDVISSSKVDASRVKVIYNGDSPYKVAQRTYAQSEHKSIIDKYNLTTHDYFVFVSTIEPRKNIPTIVRGYEEYRRNGGTQKLALVGGFGWKYGPILKLIKKCIYSSDIVLTGYVSSEDKEYLYRNATALVFPSLWEGFGFPVLEAMSVGTPCLLSRVSSLPEIGGDISYYIDDCMDYKKLGNLMKQVSSLSSIEREDLSNKCIAHSRQFSRKECAIKILNLFHSL